MNTRERSEKKNVFRNFVEELEREERSGWISADEFREKLDIPEAMTQRNMRKFKEWYRNEYDGDVDIKFCSDTGSKALMYVVPDEERFDTEKQAKKVPERFREAVERIVEKIHKQSSFRCSEIRRCQT